MKNLNTIIILLFNQSKLWSFKKNLPRDCNWGLGKSLRKSRVYLGFYVTFSTVQVILRWVVSIGGGRQYLQLVSSFGVYVGAKLKISPILRLSLAHFRILSLADNLKMGWPVPAHLKMGKFTMIINYEELDVTFVLVSNYEIEITRLCLCRVSV